MHRIAAAVAALIVAASLLVTTPAQANTCPPPPVRIAVVGDSITSWDPPFKGIKGQSWVFTATSYRIQLVGGWAYPGATIARMESNLTHADADVFLMLVGTNDLELPSIGRAGTPVMDRFATMDRMVATMGAKTTMVVAVPPWGHGYEFSNLWNMQLRDYAAARNFRFIDPWVGVRDATGAWLPGADRGDRVHPSPTSAAIAGGLIKRALSSGTAMAKSPRPVTAGPAVLPLTQACR